MNSPASRPLADLPAQNTDRELWRDHEGHYAASVFVTQDGGIGMRIGGLVFVMSVAEWHDLASRAAPEPHNRRIGDKPGGQGVWLPEDREPSERMLTIARRWKTATDCAWSMAECLADGRPIEHAISRAAAFLEVRVGSPEPTEAMIDAATDCYHGGRYTGPDRWEMRNKVAQMLRAALGASPPPEIQK